MRGKGTSRVSKEQQTIAGSNEPCVQRGAHLYDHEFAVTAKRLVDLGFSDDDICCMFGVDSEILSRWQLDHPEFASALSRTKEQNTCLVEAALLERAVGYERENKKVWAVGPSRKPLTVRIVEQVAPDFDALCFVLTNLDSAQWHLTPAMPPPPPPTPQEEAHELEKVLIFDQLRNLLRENAAAGGPRILADEE